MKHLSILAQKFKKFFGILVKIDFFKSANSCDFLSREFPKMPLANICELIFWGCNLPEVSRRIIAKLTESRKPFLMLIRPVKPSWTTWKKSRNLYCSSWKLFFSVTLQTGPLSIIAILENRSLKISASSSSSRFYIFVFCCLEFFSDFYIFLRFSKFLDFQNS